MPELDAHVVAYLVSLEESRLGEGVLLPSSVYVVHSDWTPRMDCQRMLV